MDIGRVVVVVSTLPVVVAGRPLEDSDPTAACPEAQAPRVTDTNRNKRPAAKATSLLGEGRAYLVRLPSIESLPSMSGLEQTCL
jgi:hypothetical protein